MKYNSEAEILQIKLVNNFLFKIAVNMNIENKSRELD
jgi:hypothetical protein